MPLTKLGRPSVMRREPTCHGVGSSGVWGTGGGVCHGGPCQGPWATASFGAGAEGSVVAPTPTQGCADRTTQERESDAEGHGPVVRRICALCHAAQLW